MRVPRPEEFVDYMRDKGLRTFDSHVRSYNLNIVGFRNRFARTNQFDDIIGVYWAERSGWTARYYQATTLPGLPSLLKPVSVRGTAILVPGQYVGAYAIGKHKGQYRALVQVKPVRVYRDRNLNARFDKVSEETGLFGINIHRATLAARVVGADSAGCQVIKNRNDYDAFMNLCLLGRENWGNRFTYTLVEES